MDDNILQSQQIVTDVFRSFRSELMKFYGKVEFKRKTDMSQVTLLDIRVEETLHAKLREVYTDDELGFEGEETGASGNRSSYWLVDPIDGTAPFIRGLPFCTNMAVLVHKDVSQAVVIYDFVADAMYTAILGRGAYKNGQQIRVSPRQLEDSMIVIESPEFAEIRNLVKGTGLKCITPVVSAGHGFIMTAEGKLEGRVQYRGYGKVYDYAPGALLVKEAGGELVTLTGDPYTVYTREFAAVTPAIAQYIQQQQSALADIHQQTPNNPSVGTV